MDPSLGRAGAFCHVDAAAVSMPTPSCGGCTTSRRRVCFLLSVLCSLQEAS
jgi:hypothetical protein